MTNKITVRGNITLGASMVISGTGILEVDNTCTLTSNGKTWPNGFTILTGFLSTFTVTLVGDFTVSGLFSTVGLATKTINKTTVEILTVSGGISIGDSTIGTAKIKLTGGTWTSVAVGFSNDLDIDGNITVSGSVYYQLGIMTYVSGSVTTTSSTLVIRYGGTYNVSSVTWNNVTIGSGVGAITSTLTSDLNISGLLTISTSSQTINRTTTEKINAAGGLTANIDFSGTAEFNLTGGTWSANSSGIAGSNVTLNGNITISGTVIKQAGTLKYTSGTITTTSSTLLVRFGTTTLDTNGVTWDNITIGSGVGATTTTLTSNLLCSGLLTITGAEQTINRTTAETVTSSGGLTVNNSCVGTAKVILTGGTWSGSNTTGIVNSLDLQGTITVSGNVYYRTGTLTWVSGAITTTSSTLNLTGSCTLATNTMTWNNITLSNTSALTYTINSLLTATGTLTIGTGAVQTFAGTAGFTVGTLTCNNTGATTINYKESITYTISNLDCSKARNGSAVLFTSSHASTRANIVIPNNGTTTCNTNANFTRIDASGGRTINSFASSISDCINVRQYFDYQPVAFT